MSVTDAALPDWVMLERFVFRRDDPASFREDKRTSATCTTCTGARFDVSFVLAEPPTPSRLYLSWPEGPKDEQVCHLVAAHRDLVLLRLDSLVDESEPYGEARHEYFIYIADPRSQVPPLLRSLPQCLEHNYILEKPTTRPFLPLAVGLLCHGEDEFVVASLGMRRSHETSEMQADLWILRSSSTCRDNSAEKWEKKLLHILYNEDEYYDLLYWVTDKVVPFKNALCWVNCARGILLCDGIFGDNPKVFYIRFPLDSFSLADPRRVRKELYRSLCVTDGGRRLVFVDVGRHDGAGLGSMAYRTGFTITILTLKTEENVDSIRWEWIEDNVVTSGQLWEANTSSRLPHEVMMLPLLSIDMPNILHTVLFDWKVGRFSLVAIDLSEKQVLGSVVTYIKSSKEGLSVDDADLVRAKPSFFTHFLPSEFSKFLNLSR